MELLIILLIVWAAFGALGYYIATQKGRPQAEGLLLGFLFGPLGVLLVALLPSKSAEQHGRAVGRRDRVASMPDYRDDCDEPVIPKSDHIDDQVLGYLGVDTGPKKPQGIDVDAIARAAKRANLAPGMPSEPADEKWAIPPARTPQGLRPL